MPTVDVHRKHNPPKRRPYPKSSRGFWAAWGGWTLDGMDSFIYALVLVPSLRDLLPHSGIAATKANVGRYGGLLFALFLIGWGLAFLWGPWAINLARANADADGCLVFGVHISHAWSLTSGSWRPCVCSPGSVSAASGPWAVPSSRKNGRRTAVALARATCTLDYVGIFLAAILNYLIGSKFGWRWMFAVGGLACPLAGVVRHGVTEPECWQKKEKVVHTWRIWQPFATLFSNALRRRTILNTLYMLASICGLWAGTVYVPAAVTALAEAAGRVGPQAAQLASTATMLVAFATILGCLAMPRLAENSAGAGLSHFILP